VIQLHHLKFSSPIACTYIDISFFSFLSIYNRNLSICTDLMFHAWWSTVRCAC